MIISWSKIASDMLGKLNVIEKPVTKFDYILFSNRNPKNDMCWYVATTSVVNVSAQINSILMLNETNFKTRKKVVQIVLNCMDLGLMLQVEDLIPTMDNL
ncbi:hypothetical protein CR513_10246, partial [Mucuna pruriens]